MFTVSPEDEGEAGEIESPVYGSCHVDPAASAASPKLVVAGVKSSRSV
jgi:hypothetical protein